MADLKAIRNASAELSEAEPPARLWVSLRNQLEAEGLIREAEAEVVAAASRPSFWLRLRPAMAAAYLAVIAVLGIWIGTSLTPAPEPEPPAAPVRPRVEKLTDLLVSARTMDS